MQANPILLRRKYTCIVKLFAEQVGMTYEHALDFSTTPRLLNSLATGVADMHAFSDAYLAEKLAIDYRKTLNDAHTA